MEYADLALSRGMPIDLDYYMSSNICAQLARLIHWKPQFNQSHHPNATYDEREEAAMKAATAFVNQQCEKWSKKWTSYGTMHQQLFRSTNAAFRACMAAIGGMDDVLQMVWLDKGASTGWEGNNNIFDVLNQKTATVAKREAEYAARRVVQNPW